VKIYAIYLIPIARAELAVGLGILMAFYRLRGSTNTITKE
jgi:NADH:ubiquinone oxidoreductase subunit K